MLGWFIQSDRNQMDDRVCSTCDCISASGWRETVLDRNILLSQLVAVHPLCPLFLFSVQEHAQETLLQAVCGRDDMTWTTYLQVVWTT